MMGDSEGPATDQRIPTVNQTGSVSNSFINDSQVAIVNLNVNFHIHYQSQPQAGEPCTVQRPEDTGQCPEDTGQRSEYPGQRPEDTGQRSEDPGLRPEDTGQRPEDTGHRPEDGEVDGDSDEHKELENSLSLSGTHERQGAGSIQDLGAANDDERKEMNNSLSGSHDVHLDDNPQGGDGGLALEAEAGANSGCPTPTHLTPNTPWRRLTVYEEEVSISDASDTYVKVDIEDVHDTSSVPSSTEIGQHFAEVDEVPVVGSPMPPESSCKITPHPCSVYSSKVWKYTRPFGYVGNFIRRETKSLRRVCLVGNALCISSSTRNVIECVVDLAEEALCLEGCDLTVGRWVIALPESKLSEWKSVSVEIKSRTAPGCAQWSSSPDVRAEAKRKARSLPQALSFADLLEDTEVSEPEECQGTDEPVPVFKSPASMCSSTTDLQ